MTAHSQSETREKILNTVSDLVSDFMYYDRDDDEELSAEELEDAIKGGVVTDDEIVNTFRQKLHEWLNR